MTNLIVPIVNLEYGKIILAGKNNLQNEYNAQIALDRLDTIFDEMYASIGRNTSDIYFIITNLTKYNIYINKISLILAQHLQELHGYFPEIKLHICFLNNGDKNHADIHFLIFDNLIRILKKKNVVFTNNFVGDLHVRIGDMYWIFSHKKTDAECLSKSCDIVCYTHLNKWIDHHNGQIFVQSIHGPTEQDECCEHPSSVIFNVHNGQIIEKRLFSLNDSLDI